MTNDIKYEFKIQFFIVLLLFVSMGETETSVSFVCMEYAAIQVCSSQNKIENDVGRLVRVKFKEKEKILRILDK